MLEMMDNQTSFQWFQAKQKKTENSDSALILKSVVGETLGFYFSYCN